MQLRPLVRRLLTLALGGTKGFFLTGAITFYVIAILLQMDDLNLIWLVLIVVALIAAVMYGKPRMSRFDIAQRQFLETTLHSENKMFSFDPKTATIVRQDNDPNCEFTTYPITIYARNESGEYFVYRSDGVKLSIKHLEHGIAKIVLKNEYISPQESV
jgi:hypothetical protein